MSNACFSAIKSVNAVDHLTDSIRQLRMPNPQ